MIYLTIVIVQGSSTSGQHFVFSLTLYSFTNWVPEPCWSFIRNKLRERARGDEWLYYFNAFQDSKTNNSTIFCKPLAGEIKTQRTAL